MVADSNKNSTPGEKDPEPIVKAGGDSGSASSLPRANKKKILYGSLVIIIILVGGWLIVTDKLHFGPKVYAQAAGHKIYKKDIESIKANSKSISDRDAATVLADKYLTQAMAQERDVKVTETDIAAAGCPDKKTSPYGYQNCVNQIYFTKLTDNNEGIYKGKLLVANFSRYVPYQSPLLAEYKMLNAKIGDTAAIAADKAYAQSFITNLYDQIKAGEISFDQAIAIEHNDPVVGEKAYPSQTHSGDFDGRIGQINFLAADSIRKKVTSIKPGETTKPFVVRASASSTNNSTQDSYFLVVKMDQISGGHSTVNSEQIFQQAKKKLGYKINV